MTPEKSVNMGLIKTGSEPYPVMHIGNGIYIAILSDDGPVPLALLSANRFHRSHYEYGLSRIAVLMLRAVIL